MLAPLLVWCAGEEGSLSSLSSAEGSHASPSPLHPKLAMHSPGKSEGKWAIAEGQGGECGGLVWSTASLPPVVPVMSGGRVEGGKGEGRGKDGEEARTLPAVNGAKVGRHVVNGGEGRGEKECLHVSGFGIMTIVAGIRMMTFRGFES